MQKSIKRWLSCGMVLVLMLTLLIPTQFVEAAAKKPKFNVTKKTMLVGESTTLKISNKVKNAKYVWKTSKKSVATVSSKGVVKAVGKGSAVISCSIKVNNKTKYTLKCKITVTKNNRKITSWSDYHFESMSAPPEGTQLADELWLSFESIDGISLCFVLPEGSYKFLAYDPKADMVYSDLEVPSPAEDDPSRTVYSTILEAHTNPAEFDSVIAAQPAISEAGRYYSCPDLESYILVFKPDATTSKDLLYAFKVGDLVKYLKPDVDDAIHATSGEGSTVSISLVKKLGDSETEEYYGGIFRLDYDIKDENLKGVAIPAEASFLSIDTGDSFILDFSNKGSREFKLTDMPNGTYNFYVSTEQDLKYTGSFTVDFIKYSEDKTIEISHEDPVVTFSGQPDGKVPFGESVVMHMNTNVPSMMSFDGVILGNGEYGKSFKFRVSSNGSYNYSISTTGGKCIDAVYVVDFFDETE